MSTTTELAPGTNIAIEKRSAMLDVNVGKTGLSVASGEQMWALAQGISRSGLAPKGIERPESIFIALQLGMELGLPPMAALQNIAIINGRPSLWGDSQLAVCRSTGELEAFDEWYEKGGKRLPRNPVDYSDDVVAVCKVQRKGYEPQEVGFSVADAKRAGLWGKQGPWTQYPFRMLRFRARSFALRDLFGDALRGLLSSEEAVDLPAPGMAGEKPQSEGVAALNNLLRNPVEPPPMLEAEVVKPSAPVATEIPAPDVASTDNATEAVSPDVNPAAAPEPQAAKPDAVQEDADPLAVADSEIVDAATLTNHLKLEWENQGGNGDFDALMKAVKLNNAIARLNVRRDVLTAMRAGKLGQDGKIQQ